MHPTRFPELNQVLRTLVSWIHDTLPDAFVGFYLQGSFALGDFADHSDVDFVVLVRDELEHSRVDRLQVIPDRTYKLDSEWAKHPAASHSPLQPFQDLI